MKSKKRKEWVQDIMSSAGAAVAIAFGVILAVMVIIRGLMEVI